MGKFIVRMTLVFTSIYLLVAFYVAQFLGIDILVYDLYTIPFELCVVVYCYSEGKYHCRFIKHLASGIFVTDLLVSVDNLLNFLSVSEHNAIGFCCIATGMGMTLYEAINHFYNVNKLKQKRAMLNKQNANHETI